MKFRAVLRGVEGIHPKQSLSNQQDFLKWIEDTFSKLTEEQLKTAYIEVEELRYVNVMVVRPGVKTTHAP